MELFGDWPMLADQWDGVFRWQPAAAAISASYGASFLVHVYTGVRLDDTSRHLIYVSFFARLLFLFFYFLRTAGVETGVQLGRNRKENERVELVRRHIHIKIGVKHLKFYETTVYLIL